MDAENKILEYYGLLDLCNIPQSAGTNRKRTLEYIRNNLYEFNEIKISPKKTKYLITLKLEVPIAKSSKKEFQTEKEYLLYAMMNSCIEARRHCCNINRVQLGGNAIGKYFGLYKELQLSAFDADSEEYNFIAKNYEIFKELNDLIYRKKENIYNFIADCYEVDMSKSYMFVEEFPKGKEIPYIRRIDEYFNIDILDFNYKDFINNYLKRRKRQLNAEYVKSGRTKEEIEKFKKKTFTEYNLYKYDNEYKLLIDELNTFFLSEYNREIPNGYKPVCVRNLIINEQSKYNILLKEKININNSLVKEYQKKLNEDVIKDIKKVYLDKYCNGNKNLRKYRNFLKLIDICVKLDIE